MWLTTVAWSYGASNIRGSVVCILTILLWESRRSLITECLCTTSMTDVFAWVNRRSMLLTQRMLASIGRRLLLMLDVDWLISGSLLLFETLRLARPVSLDCGLQLGLNDGVVGARAHIRIVNLLQLDEVVGLTLSRSPETVIFR